MISQALEVKNRMKLSILAKGENESFARMAVVSFITYLNPTLEEVEDIRLVVSEAVTNAIVHAYQEKEEEEIDILCELVEEQEELWLNIVVEDKGVGIENIEQAKEPLFTTKPETDRAGMGFSFMEAFTDELEIQSVKGQGTIVKMRKKMRVKRLDT